MQALRDDRADAQAKQQQVATMTQLAEAAGKVSPFMKQAGELAGAGNGQAKR